MRPQGSPVELERRRLRAIDLLQRDVPVHVVADRLGVDRRSVRRWKRAHRGRGRAGLRARPASGRPPKLTAAQRKQLARLVVAGPEAAGYATSLWTCRRVQRVGRIPDGYLNSLPMPDIQVRADSRPSKPSR
jgi:transposase